MSDETVGPHAGTGGAAGEEAHAEAHVDPWGLPVTCAHRWVQLCDRSGPVVQGPIRVNRPPKSILEEYYAVFFCDRCLETTRQRIRGRRYSCANGLSALSEETR